jgi:hypothetical protein
MIYTLDSHAMILQLLAGHRLAVKNASQQWCEVLRCVLGRHLARRELLNGLRSREDGPHGIATGAKIFRLD